MNLGNVLKTVAPWIGTALGGPLGGIAVEAIANVFGLSDKTEASLKNAISGATPEQLLALKQADQDFAIQMRQLGINEIKDLESLAAADRDSARKREISVGDWTPRILAYIIITGFLGALTAVLSGKTPVDSVLAGTLIGYISAKAELVLTYYFGSNAASEARAAARLNLPEVTK